jgi:hypothetical protein
MALCSPMNCLQAVLSESGPLGCFRHCRISDVLPAPAILRLGCPSAVGTDGMISRPRTHRPRSLTTMIEQFGGMDGAEGT